jgi:hypothetical protein
LRQGVILAVLVIVVSRARTFGRDHQRADRTLWCTLFSEELALHWF